MARLPKPDDVPPVRRNWAQPIGNDASRLGNAAFNRAGFADATLVLHWTDIVGPDVARLARPIKLVDKNGATLTLKAEAAASVFLQHETRELCARINAYLGREAVTKLRFIYGSIAPGRDPAPESKPRERDIEPHDPVNAFTGPDALKQALSNLARRRQG